MLNYYFLQKQVFCFQWFFLEFQLCWQYYLWWSKLAFDTFIQNSLVFNGTVDLYRYFVSSWSSYIYERFWVLPLTYYESLWNHWETFGKIVFCFSITLNFVGLIPKGILLPTLKSLPSFSTLKPLEVRSCCVPGRVICHPQGKGIYI